MSDTNMSPVEWPSTTGKDLEEFHFFSQLPNEVRQMVYLCLDTDRTIEFNLKEDNNEYEDTKRHELAGALYGNKEMRAALRHRYLTQFGVIVELGGPGDHIDFDFEYADNAKWLFLSGITHVRDFTIDYETGYRAENSGDRDMAKGTINVSVLNSDTIDPFVQVTGWTSCTFSDSLKVEKYKGNKWPLLVKTKKLVEDWIAASKIKLISCSLMNTICYDLMHDVEGFVAIIDESTDEKEGNDNEADENEDEENESEDGDSEDNSENKSDDGAEETSSITSAGVVEDEEK